MIVGIRADGGFKIGLGHIYKSIWLANALREKNFKVIFLTTEEHVSNRLIADKGFETVIFPKDWSENQKIQRLNNWISKQKPNFLIIDHWSWPNEFWSQLKHEEKTVYVGMDVPPEGISHFDVAFQGIRDTLETKESFSSGCKTFNGVDYLLMSPEFRAYKNGWKPPSEFKKILLTFGGTDVENFSAKSLEFFNSKSWDFEIDLVMGSGVSDIKLIQKKTSESSLQINLMSNVSCLPKLMVSADLAISTGGLGTLSELGFTGTPAIIVSAVDHQKENAFKFREYGILDRTINLGVWSDEIENDLNYFLENANRLKELSNNWNGIIDGEGINRIVKVFESYRN